MSTLIDKANEFLSIKHSSDFIQKRNRSKRLFIEYRRCKPIGTWKNTNLYQCYLQNEMTKLSHQYNENNNKVIIEHEPEFQSIEYILDEEDIEVDNDQDETEIGESNTDDYIGSVGSNSYEEPIEELLSLFYYPKV